MIRMVLGHIVWWLEWQTAPAARSYKVARAEHVPGRLA
jgi:hypothetical protein